MTLLGFLFPVRRSGQVGNPEFVVRFGIGRRGRTEDDLGVGRPGQDSFQLELKYQRPDLDLVAGVELLFPAEENAVDEGAVAAAEVAEEDGVVGDTQEAVLPADHGAIGSDVAFVPPAKVIIPPGKEQVLSPRLTLDDQ